ncbi:MULTISPECIES: DeoR/GlpR family DNA-binding transcription regulator [unclassified Ruegeria]|uniref:DeoR/GlpR family DNA-binding transcription regulator n=1 Tax=unclassified Ruegeria TaxID=2625375 RepID=UPI001AE7DE3C|nr:MULTISPECIES: DeoR/GlpR family DNA-binding transcription regulator [unclassified Ruegeria]
MSKTKTRAKTIEKGRGRVKKSDRRQQILLELKLRPHVRINELAQRFNVSNETVRRDFDALSNDGLIARAHGGASAPAQGHYPGLDERANARIEERERIGISAAGLVRDGETVMIDSGSTTIEMARALAYLGTPCTVITNSIPVAMTLGHGAAEVLLCPGEYLATESATIGTETLEFLSRFNVDRCMIGSSGFSAEGPSETVRGFAAVKRMMLTRAANRHLLIDSGKFGRKGLSQVGDLTNLDSIVSDTKPTGELLNAINGAEVDVLVAP